MLKPLFVLLAFAACALLPSGAAAQARVRVAVLDFGGTATGVRASEKLSRAFASEQGLSLADREESRTAARGAGYAGSLNMALDGAALLRGLRLRLRRQLAHGPARHVGPPELRGGLARRGRKNSTRRIGPAGRALRRKDSPGARVGIWRARG